MLLFTGGKTGGHIMPLISLIEYTKEKSIYVGQYNNLEEKICKNLNIEFVGFYLSDKKPTSIFKAYKQIKKKLLTKDITAVIASGGLVSFIACLFAIRYKKPLFLLEENVILGSSNKILRPFCKKIFYAYQPINKDKKGIITGLPIRNINLYPSINNYDILVIGGSLGSKILCDVATYISKDYKVCLIAGRYYKDISKNKNLDVIEFSSNIFQLMKNSKLIIARAGASTTAEIFYINKPLICIPSMNTKKNHQYYNAQFFQQKKACFMCLEKNYKNEILKQVQQILNNEALRINMLEMQKKLVNYNAKQTIMSTIKENI